MEKVWKVTFWKSQPLPNMKYIQEKPTTTTYTDTLQRIARGKVGHLLIIKPGASFSTWSLAEFSAAVAAGNVLGLVDVVGRPEFTPEVKDAPYGSRPSYLSVRGQFELLNLDKNTDLITYINSTMQDYSVIFICTDSNGFYMKDGDGFNRCTISHVPVFDESNTGSRFSRIETQGKLFALKKADMSGLVGSGLGSLASFAALLDAFNGLRLYVDSSLTTVGIPIIGLQPEIELIAVSNVDSYQDFKLLDETGTQVNTTRATVADLNTDIAALTAGQYDKYTVQFTVNITPGQQFASLIAKGKVIV